MRRPPLEVADIVRQYGAAYLARYGHDTSWVPCAPRFLLPVRVLRRFFRRRFLEGLTQAVTSQRLTFAGPCQPLAQPQNWQRFVQRLHEHEWVSMPSAPCASRRTGSSLSPATPIASRSRTDGSSSWRRTRSRCAGGIPPEGITSGR